MKIISFGSLKGGVGKTTIVFNLATTLAEQGKKILLVDTDPQLSLSKTIHAEEPQNTINKVILGYCDINETIVKTIHSNIDLIYSSDGLFYLKKTLPPFWFKEQINKIKNVYDYVFIDTQSNINEFNLSVHLSSDSFIIVIDRSIMSFRSLIKLLNHYQEIQKTIKVKNFKGIVLSVVDHFKISTLLINNLESGKYKDYLLKPYIPRWSAFEKTTTFNQSLKKIKDYKAINLFNKFILTLKKKKIL